METWFPVRWEAVPGSSICPVDGGLLPQEPSQYRILLYWHFADTFVSTADSHGALLSPARASGEVRAPSVHGDRVKAAE